MIETNVNKDYLNEKKLAVFFEKCWEIKEPHSFAREEPRFERFLKSDLKSVMQKVGQAENIVEFSKFVVFFGVEEDPEVFDLLLDSFSRSIREMTVDGILTVLVNFAHTLSPEAA